MPVNTFLRGLVTLIPGDRRPAAADRKRSRVRSLSIEALESRALMAASPIPIQLTVPTAIQNQNVFVSITSKLNAPYTNSQGILLNTNDWAYYKPGGTSASPDFARGDYFKADSTTPSSDLTFALPVKSFTGETLTINVPQTAVVSGHIVMSVGAAAVVTYANNPQTNQGGISAPTPSGSNYETVYGMFEYAMATNPNDANKMLVDVDMSEVDQVSCPFTITATPPTKNSTVDLGTGITQTRADMFNLYQNYITNLGISASSFKQLVQTDSSGAKVRIMAPNNFVNYTPSPVPVPGLISPTSGTGLKLNTLYYYWVTATNGYGETTSYNYLDAQTSSGQQQMTITWAAVPGATGYSIYRSLTTSPAQAVWAGKWIPGTVKGQGNPYYIDAGATLSNKTFPGTNYLYYPQDYYFNNAIRQFFSHYATNTFSIDVPMTMKINGQDQTAIYTLSGKTVSNFQAEGTDNAMHNYVALVLTGTTTTAGFPDTTNQKFAVLRPYFQENMNSTAFPKAPAWISNPTASPGVMVFGNDGVFNTGGRQPLVNAQLLSNLENPIVSAFNRGIANNYAINPNNWANAPAVYAIATSSPGNLKKDAYFYVVTATNSYGETTASLEYSATITSDPDTAHPQNSNNSISLQWKADNKPTKYNIYRSTTQGFGYQLIGSVNNPDHTNHNIPVTSFVDTGYTANPAKTPFVYYAPGSTSNWYSGFLHQNSTNNPTTGVSVRGLAYGFGYDDQGGQSTNMGGAYTQVNINLKPWAAAPITPVKFDPTPNAPLKLQILMQPKSIQLGSTTTISFKAFGPEGQTFVGGTQVKVEVVGAQKGSYMVKVNVISGFGILTFKSTVTGYSYLKLTQSDGKTYNSKVFNVLPTGIPLSLMYIFDQGSDRLSKSAGFYASLDRIARLTTGAAAAETDAKIAPILKIDGVQAKQSIFQAARRKELLVIRTAEDARGHFDDANLESLTKKVDFAQQIVLVFAWRGSGQDRLESQVAESYPEQVTFSLTPGRTKDLRSHVEIYALRSNVKWTVR